MVNGFRYYRALESISIASALSTALTIYPRQIRVHQRWQSKLQLPTARKKEWRPATAVTCQHCDTHYFSGLEPATFRSLVRRATSSATEPTNLWAAQPHAYTLLRPTITSAKEQFWQYSVLLLVDQIVAQMLPNGVWWIAFILAVKGM